MMNWDRYVSLNRAGQADFHTHTLYCDGTATPEEMIISAISKGLKVYGFSGHGYTFYDESYCMMPDEMNRYRKEVRALAAKYEDKIEILCGIEQDCLAGKPEGEWDYVIGSVHYIKCGDEYIPIDETQDILLDIAARYFGGDIYKLTSKYFETIGEVYEATEADFVGHFDLISKFNQGGELGTREPDGNRLGGALFNEGDPRYVKAWKAAADKLLKAGIPFEINTGGISRGYRSDAYPAKPIREYLKAKGAKFILSSDSHNVDTLCFEFDNADYRSGLYEEDMD